MKKLIILVAVALINTAAFAQTTWNSDKAHSKLQFTITHLAVSDVDGWFKDFSATIVSAKPDFSDAKFTLTVNTASINTESDQRDGHLKSADFFDVAAYPTMTFVSTGISKTATANHYKLNGNLTLHGTTKAVSLDLWYRGTITNPMSKADDAGFQVTGTIKRSDFAFGSKFGSPMLSDEVAIKANGEFAKAN
ncbi:YceI family protein [Mucilaginibacter sp. BJC16-A38]|uniref:YceI family protein n=1 Tax=Mucilaginibacter phenanthrenivorans TaxID=1234842 RepID=UPI002157439A|nr:YceI family protein [Mucilaginibacter phenanthrenivorans]MCR8559469.1 YceI family protein [Mucilaginibacter phenanthrenivorans]